jgi:hypothetical protein
MAVWTEEELRRIGNALELEIAPIRADGTTRTPRPIWVARAGGDLYVRAAYGSRSAWHRIARESGRARISAAGAETDITVEDADKRVLDQVDTAYREKYGRRYASIVDTTNDPEHRATTLRLLPRNED